MRHGGGGGGVGKEDGEDVTGMKPVGLWTGVLPFIALWGLFGMPRRWPRAFVMTCVIAVLVLPFWISLGDQATTSTPGALMVLFGGWWISRTYMRAEHYKPSPRKTAKKVAQASAMTQYDHLRGTTTWNNKVTENK